MRSLEERQAERALRDKTAAHNLRHKPAGEAQSSYDLSEDGLHALDMRELHDWANEHGLKIPKEVSGKGKDAVSAYIVNARKAKEAAPEGAAVEGWNANR